MKGQRNFVAIVAGENHADIMKKYDNKEKVEAYVKYRYSEAENYKENKLKLLKAALTEFDKKFSDSERDYILEEIDTIEKMPIEEFYDELTSDCELSINGDAMTDANPNGKFDEYNVGKYFSNPFILKSGAEVYTARKGDIDWDKVLHEDRKPYEVAWDTVMGGVEPKDDFERNIYENMKERTAYFMNFKEKEIYVSFCTSFFGYAFVDYNKWEDMDGKPQIDWVTKFYDNFIKDLPDDTILTIYECFRQ